MDYLYDPALDRLDVAIRAVWRDATKRDGALLAEVGIPREVVEAVRDYARPGTETSVFHLIREVPTVLDAALVLLRAYYQRCGAGRTEFYALLNRLGRFDGAVSA